MDFFALSLYPKCKTICVASVFFMDSGSQLTFTPTSILPPHQGEEELGRGLLLGDARNDEVR